ncbi:MAG: hypothetical protein D6828_01005 [Nitrospirae bacterium]|nr:MAG: hypothetical protein D6828_01005 [Nitrospirota bacterium]
MSVTNRHILITGSPGIGRTTLVKRLFEHLKHLKPVGFYTQEIRDGKIRKGEEDPLPCGYKRSF